MKIEFCSLAHSDFPLFRKWLSETHVQPFWQETDDDTKLREKLFEKHLQMGVCSNLILVDETPVGYIQHYEACRVGGNWWPGVKPGVFGVDLFIGDPHFYSKGWGPKFLTHYLRDMISKNTVEEIIIDPDPTNTRAISAFEKVGFQKKDVIDTPNGKAQLMFLDPNKFLNPKFSLKILDHSWVSKLQNLLKAAPQYHLKVEGVLPGKNAARDALLSGPPGFEMKDKHGFGFFQNDLFLGYIDIANGYPKKGIAYLGLLLIDESFHGVGLGTRAFELIETEIKKWNCQKIRLSVAETNDVVGFWEKMGFRKTGRVLKPQQTEIVCDVIEMEKSI